jgi:hypothetical protein
MMATSISGFVYAQMNDTIIINNEMTFGRWNDPPNMGFVEPLTWSDNEVTKNVGECICYYTDYKIDPGTGWDGHNTTLIIINNGYPGYRVHCNFTVKNIGQLALHINETVISDPTSALTWNAALNALVDADDKPVLNISIIPDLVCNNLLSGETLEAEIGIHITQNAKQSHTYHFQVEITYEEA